MDRKKKEYEKTLEEQKSARLKELEAREIKLKEINDLKQE